MELEFKFREINSPVGSYESGWKINEDGSLEFKFVIPFNATASLILPDANLDNIYVNGKLLKETQLNYNRNNEGACIDLISGVYKFKYMPTKSYIKYYSTSMSLKELLESDEVKKYFQKI